MRAALEAALTELVLGPPLDVEDAGALGRWLARHGIAGADAEALAGGEARRWLQYRVLVRGTLRKALLAAVPRSAARLGALFDEYFDRFLAERGPRTHYLRDVTGELLDFATPLWARDARVPAYLPELARHEALHVEIAAAPRRAAPAPVELALDAGLAFVEAARVVHYEHAVHRLPEAETDRSEPERRATDLFVYRDPEHDVRYLELTPLAADILERLLAGRSLRASLEGALTARALVLDESISTGTARLLSDLAERGAVLGARAAIAAEDANEPAGGGKREARRA